MRTPFRWRVRARPSLRTSASALCSGSLPLQRVSMCTLISPEVRDSARRMASTTSACSARESSVSTARPELAASSSPRPHPRRDRAALQDVEQALGRGAHTARIVALTQVWNESLLPDGFALQIGQHRFGAVADLDAPAVVLDIDGQEDAVVLGLLSHAPLAKDFVRQRGRVFALEGSKDRDDDLRAAELRLDALAVCGRSHS